MLNTSGYELVRAVRAESRYSIGSSGVRVTHFVCLSYGFVRQH